MTKGTKVTLYLGLKLGHYVANSNAIAHIQVVTNVTYRPLLSLKSFCGLRKSKPKNR